MLSLNAVERAWVLHQLSVQTLLTSPGSPYPFGGMDGGWARGDDSRGQKE